MKLYGKTLCNLQKTLGIFPHGLGVMGVYNKIQLSRLHECDQASLIKP